MIQVVVAVHRHFFGLCGGVMVGGNRTVIAAATSSARYDQGCDDRALQQQRCDQTEERVPAAANEEIRDLASELHNRPMMVSMIRKNRQISLPEEACGGTAPSEPAGHSAGRAKVDGIVKAQSSLIELTSSVSPFTSPVTSTRR